MNKNKNKINTTDPDTTTNLALNSVVQVQFASSAPSLKETLKNTRHTLAASNNADEKVLSVTASKIESKGTPVGAIRARVNKAREEIRKLGLPITQAPGFMYLERRAIPKVQAIFDDCSADLVGLKQQVIDAWPDLVAEGKRGLGDFKDADNIVWPDADDFVKGFSIGLTWLAQPQAISDDVLKGMAAEVRAQTLASSRKAVEDQLRAAHYAPLSKVVASLGEMVAGFQKGKERFRQEPFDAIKEAAEELRDKNWLAIPELNDLADELDSLGSVDIVAAAPEEREKAFAKAASTKEKLAAASAKMSAALGI